jgi:Cd2+/Zn2+-exporting ATPase
LGHPEEGALLLFLFVLAGALEELAMARARREVEALHTLMPTEALVFRNNAWTAAAAESLAPGERVKVRPGERVPADARVEVGESLIDQSAITGESMPRHVRLGDELFAGTINTDDVVEATVLRRVSESSLQKILDLVTRAREQREPVQRTIDRVSQPYAVSVLVISVGVFLVWWLLLSRPWHDSMYTAITLLIVASPCALVIATPTATLAAIARGARGGVLFKGGQSIDQLANVGSVCMDKTGTLTYGRPRLYQVHPVAWSDGSELLAIAAGLEADSTHPIASAIREAAKQRGVTHAHVEQINHTTAQGLEGAHEGRPVRLGRYSFAEPLIPICFRNRVQEVLGKIQDRGHIAVVVARGGPAAGDVALADAGDTAAGGEVAVLIMADTVRPGASTLVRDLHALGISPVRMLTGDNKVTAQRVGDSLGLDIVDADLLPADKLRIVGEMKQDAARTNRRASDAPAESPEMGASTHAPRRHTHVLAGGVAVVGDGVNDAPALAASDVAIAIGTIGTAAALESADVVLLSDDLATVPWAIRLARRARWTIKANLTLALSVIVLMGIATLVGSLTGHPVRLAVGVLAHEGGTLLVVANSLLLLAFRKATPVRA